MDGFSRYLLDERPLTIQPTLVKIFGFEQATILQQFHWLLNQPRTGVEHDGQKWIWGTYKEWCDDYFTFWEDRTLRYHMNKLQKTGIIVTKQLRKTEWDRTNYYTIDYANFDASIRQHIDASKGQQDDASKGQQDDASKGQQDDASLYRTNKTTNKTTDKTREPLADDKDDLTPIIRPPNQVSLATPPGDSSDVKIVADTLHKVGVAFSDFIIEQYMNLASDYGIDNTIRGILAAAENGKQQRFKYVAACIENIANGTPPNYTKGVANETRKRSNSNRPATPTPNDARRAEFDRRHTSIMADEINGDIDPAEAERRYVELERDFPDYM